MAWDRFLPESSMVSKQRPVIIPLFNATSDDSQTMSAGYRFVPEALRRTGTDSGVRVTLNHYLLPATDI